MNCYINITRAVNIQTARNINIIIDLIRNVNINVDIVVIIIYVLPVICTTITRFAAINELDQILNSLPDFPKIRRLRNRGCVIIMVIIFWGLILDNRIT